MTPASARRIAPVRARRLVSLGLGLACLALAACSTPPRTGELGPVRQATNVRGPESWPVEIRRGAVLPAHDATGRLPAEFVRAHDQNWQRALAATQRAEFVALPRPVLADLAGRETLDPTAPLPPGLLGRLAEAAGADAILFLELTESAPYPPLALGFRARLVTIPAADTLWMADEIFDARDPATARGARLHARAAAQGPGDPAAAILQSPSRFADYAFHAVADLLPRRLAPEIGETASLRAKSHPVRADAPGRKPNGVPST
jgi:hypothetical protein